MRFAWFSSASAVSKVPEGKGLLQAFPSTMSDFDSPRVQVWVLHPMHFHTRRYKKAVCILLESTSWGEGYCQTQQHQIGRQMLSFEALLMHEAITDMQTSYMSMYLWYLMIWTSTKSVLKTSALFVCWCARLHLRSVCSKICIEFLAAEPSWQALVPGSRSLWLHSFRCLRLLESAKIWTTETYSEVRGTHWGGMTISLSLALFGTWSLPGELANALDQDLIYTYIYIRQFHYIWVLFQYIWVLQRCWYILRSDWNIQSFFSKPAIHHHFFFTKPAIHHLHHDENIKNNVSDVKTNQMSMMSMMSNVNDVKLLQSRRFFFFITFCLQSCHISPCGQLAPASLKEHSHSQGSCRHSLSDLPWPIGSHSCSCCLPALVWSLSLWHSERS